jgi:cytochrome P450
MNQLRQMQSVPDRLPAVPKPPATPLSFLRYVRIASDNPIAAFHADVYQQWIVETKLWKLHTFIVNDPAGIRHILVDNADNYIKGNIEQRVAAGSSSEVFNAGEEWRDRRRTMSSILDYRSLPGNSSIILECTQSLLDRWSSLQPGTVIEVSAGMSSLTLEIISRLIFSSDRVDMARAIESTFAGTQSDPLFDLLDFAPLLDRPWAGYKLYRMRRRFRDLTAAIDRLMTKRAHGEKPERDDLLGRLMRERDSAFRRPLSAEEIHTQIITVIGAGHQSVALALTWIWYLLSLHPTLEGHLQAELDEVLAGRSPSVEDIPRLPYMRTIIEESLRLYPPFPIMAWRRALADDEVCGVKITRGATVTIAPWVLHRHAKLWDYPDRFDPDRFSPPRSAGRSRYAYLPFGTGPRVCIGASFAMMEIAMILASLAQRYRLRILPDHPVEPQGLITLRPRYGLKATLENRV